jgi:hypothetical protein
VRNIAHIPGPSGSAEKREREKKNKFGSCKGAFFFRKWDSFFKSPNLLKKLFQKNYPELEITAHISKQLIQIFGEIGRFDKRISLCEKKPPLVIESIYPMIPEMSLGFQIRVGKQ